MFLKEIKIMEPKLFNMEIILASIKSGLSLHSTNRLLNISVNNQKAILTKVQEDF